MTNKPAFLIDLAQNAQSGLDAQQLLETLDNSVTFHTSHHLRPALGIYNVSTHRVLEKVRQLCKRLELYMYAGPDSPTSNGQSEATQALIDYVELALYAAAEHVDDIEHIAKHFYRTERERKSCKAYKKLQEEIKQHKRFISALANHVKHSQHRIRLFYLEYRHAGHDGVFHGYIIESVTDGVVGPSPIFHSSDRSVFSITSLAWEIIVFVLNSSRSLRSFLSTKKRVEGPTKTHSPHLVKAIIAAARLPLYNLDDEHPFTTATLRLNWNDSSYQEASSLIYGSISNKWLQSKSIQFGNGGAAFAGDGITRTFKMLVSPSRVGLQHWQQA